jgi:hypothetical protein
VLQRDRFEQKGKLLLCRLFPVGGQADMTENEVYGAEAYRKAGRSLMCRIASGEVQHKDDGKGEFEVQMIEIQADHVAGFFSVFERHKWWQFGDCDYD